MIEGPFELLRAREFIEGAWTTAGLMKAMQGLFDHFAAQSAKILNFSNDIKQFVEETYAYFHNSFGFTPLDAPALNLEKHTLAMTTLLYPGPWTSMRGSPLKRRAAEASPKNMPRLALRMISPPPAWSAG